MGRLSNRDVDGLIQDQYEDALADDEPWARDAYDYRRWAALHGKTVEVECIEDGMKAIGVWEWHGQTGPDFYLVYINDPDGNVILGTDPRNFSTVKIAGAESERSRG